MISALRYCIFDPEMVNWTGTRQHYQSLTSIVMDVERRLWLMPAADMLSPEAKKALVVTYARRLELITAFTMEIQLHKYLIKKNFAALIFPQSISQKERIAASAALLAELKVNQKMLWEKFPRLLELVQLSKTHFINFVQEFLLAFHENQIELEKTLLGGRRISKILHLKCDAGDSHNKGRVVMLVKTDAGKLVYKPHDLSIDKHMHEFLEKHFSAVTSAPAAVCCGSVGFCEFIENMPAANETEAKAYYYNLGGLIAILYMLGAMDFHEENMLTRDLKPVPIDLETIMNPESANEKMQQESQFNKALGVSVIKTGVGPMRVGPRESSPLHDSSEANASAPYFDGHRQTVRAYENDLLQGFRSICHYCLEHRDEILEDLWAMQHDKLRVVIRGSQAYCNLLFKTYQTGWLKETNVSEKVQQALTDSKILEHNHKLQNIAGAEAEAICRGDVPYFCLEAGGHDLLGEDRVVVEDYCALSAIEAAEAHFQCIDSKEIDFQCQLLHSICHKAVYLVDSEQKKQNEGQQPVIELPGISPAQLVTEAESIFEAICQDALTFTDGKLYWLGVEDKLRTAAVGMDEGLWYGNGGLAVFFAALARTSKRVDIKNKASELAEEQLARLLKEIAERQGLQLQLEAEGREPLPLNLGLQNGEAGKLVVLCLLGRYLNKLPKVLPACMALLQLVQKHPWRKGDYGMADGLAGLLWTLCQYQELWELPGVQQLAVQLTEELLANQIATDREIPGVKLWQNDKLQWALSGYSRGQAGIAAALTLAGQKLGRQDALAAARQALQYENSLYLKDEGSWPSLEENRYCQEPAYGLDGGTAGIGLALLNCTGGLAKENLLKAMQAVAKQPLLYCDSLAQGNCLQAEFLMLAYQHTKDRKWKTRAEQLLAAMVKRARQQGGYQYLPAAYSPVFLPIFLKGAAGVGYTLLRAADPKTVSSVFA